jgi:hypothetical protein
VQPVASGKTRHHMRTVFKLQVWLLLADRRNLLLAN